MRVAVTTQDLIERMAERSGHALEMHDDTAYLVVGSTTWTAPLAPVTR